MFVLFELLLAMFVIVVMLRRRFSIGSAMLAGGIVIWLLSSAPLTAFLIAIINTFKKSTTYEIVFALFFVMCLEYQLRTSGTLDGLMNSMRSILPNDILTLAAMPAFLGLLPSLGGARFSAPMVETASKPFSLTSEKKTTINFWFRHVFEYTNPIIPGILLAASIAEIPLSTFVLHLCWLTPIALIIGWIFCLTDIRQDNANKKSSSAEVYNKTRFLILAFAPIIANFILVVLFHIDAAVSMGIVVLAMTLILRQSFTDIKKMLIEALDLKLIFGVISILLFQNILITTSTLTAAVEYFKAANLPLPIMTSIIAFIVGILTGASQGYVAIVFPIVAALAPGDINMIILAYFMGFTGQMITPTHLCIIVTMDYFKADFLKSLKPVLVMQSIMVLIFLAVTNLF